MSIDDLAHEIWAAAQRLPGEGIEDGVARIAAILDRDKSCTAVAAAAVTEAVRLKDENRRRAAIVQGPSERNPGFVGAGTWAVHAEYMTEQRDAALEQVATLKASLARALAAASALDIWKDGSVPYKKAWEEVEALQAELEE